MTNERAIEILTNAIQTEYMTAEQDGALAIAQKTIEKQIPKKPILADKHIRYVECYKCPSCEKNFSGRIADYCYHCGQKLDWRDSE